MGNYSSLSWVRDLCSYQTVWSTHPFSVPPAYHFTLVQFPNNTALILLPEADQISPLVASETFTQRRIRRIGLGSQHVNGSVNLATDDGDPPAGQCALQIKKSFDLASKFQGSKSDWVAIEHAETSLIHGSWGGHFGLDLALIHWSMNTVTLEVSCSV